MDEKVKKKCPHPHGCSIAVTVDVIGGKWKGIILYYLAMGTKRFSELRKLMPNTTQRMLTLQLRELEEDGIINRKIFQKIPPKVEYSLSEFGETLKPIISAMRDWGEEYEDNLKKVRLQKKKYEIRINKKFQLK